MINTGGILSLFGISIVINILECLPDKIFTTFQKRNILQFGGDISKNICHRFVITYKWFLRGFKHFRTGYFGKLKFETTVNGKYSHEFTLRSAVSLSEWMYSVYFRKVICASFCKSGKGHISVTAFWFEIFKQLLSFSSDKFYMTEHIALSNINRSYFTGPYI